MGMKAPVQAVIVCWGKDHTDRKGKDKGLRSGYGVEKSVWIRLQSHDENCIAIKPDEHGRMKISIIEVPKKKAKKMDEEAHELLLSSVVSLDAAVPKSEKNIFIMEAIKGKWSGKLFEDSSQKIEKINDNSIRVIVDLGQRQEKGDKEIDLKPFLSANVYLDSDDLLIQKLAKKAKGNAKTPKAIAHKLTQFVFRYMSNKNYEVGFATASEVARKKAGDCTEHSVLLAALGRALGIPSRVVTGLVYADEFENQKDVLVYHIWTKF